MSILTDQKVKELDARVHQLEAMVKALKVKLDSLETSRNKGTLRLPKDRVPSWPTSP